MSEIWVLGDNKSNIYNGTGNMWDTGTLGDIISGITFSFLDEPDVEYTGFQSYMGGNTLQAYSSSATKAIAYKNSDNSFTFYNNRDKVIVVHSHENTLNNAYSWIKAEGYGRGIKHDFAVSLKALNSTEYDKLSSNFSCTTRIVAKGSGYADSAAGSASWSKPTN